MDIHLNGWIDKSKYIWMKDRPIDRQNCKQIDHIQKGIGKNRKIQIAGVKFVRYYFDGQKRNIDA